MPESRPGDEFHEAIRARLAAHTLVRIDASASAEDAGGLHRCACCDRSIAPWEPEYEPTLAPGLYAHARCFLVWVTESITVDGHGDQADSI